MDNKIIQERLYHVTFKRDAGYNEEYTTFIADSVTDAVKLCKEYYSSNKHLEVIEVRRGNLVYRRSTKTITVNI